MLLSFFFPTWIALLLFSFLSAPTGLLLIWNRSTSLTEGLGHAALLGFALHLISPLSLLGSLFAVNLTVCMFQFLFQQVRPSTRAHEGDLQVIAAGLFSLGSILIYLLDSSQSMIEHALWGDLMAIGKQDIILLFFIVLPCVVSLFWIFPAFIAILCDQQLAYVEGRSVMYIQLLLWIFFATTITLGLRYFGALLLPAVLITPALIARSCASTPELALALAIPISMLLLTLGLISSLSFDLPTTPAICFLCSSALATHYAFTALYKRLLRKSILQ